MPLAGIGKVRHMQSRNEDMRYALRMELLEICPYHPLGLEKCAKFGLSPRYAGMSQPTAADLARYKSFLHPARNEMDSAVERDN